MDQWSISGKVVIVTGASSGIGEATARVITAAGGHPVLAGRRADRLDRLSEELAGALAVPTDVTDAAQRQALVDAALDRHGRVDGLVNNAGVSFHKPIATLDLTGFAEILDVNVVSLVGMTQVAVPALRASGAGRIVNVSSGTTNMVLPGVGGYAASKAAVNMISAVSRKELEADGIAVSVVLPSITATEFGDGIFQAGQEIRPGIRAHSAEYVGQVILRALVTGEERIDIPHGPEQAALTQIPAK